MKIKTHINCLFALLAVVCLLPTNSVIAAGTTTGTSYVFNPVSPNPPRSCTLPNGVSIVAGVNMSSGSPVADATATFPRIVNNPNNMTGSYLQWDYTFTYPNITFIGTTAKSTPKLYLSVSDDTALFSTSPTLLNTPGAICGANSNVFPCEAQMLTFPTSNENTIATNTYTASYITPLGYSPRLATAGASKPGDNTSTQYCLMAGAGTITPSAVNQATVQSEIITTPGCNVTLTKDSSGHVLTAVSDNSTNCQIETTATPYICDNVNGAPGNCKLIVSDLPEKGLVSEGSCNYSYTNGMGGKTTIACTACCISTMTKTCVLKSSLASPSTQCATGSYP